MTTRPVNSFAIALLSAAVMFAPQIAQAGGASSSTKFRPTSGFNIVRMNSTVIKRGGVFQQVQTGVSLPSDKCWCDDGIGSCGYSEGLCTPVGGDLGCSGICRVSKK